MLKIKFANGQELERLETIISTQYYDNANRSTMAVTLPKTAATLNAVDAILSSPANTAKVTLINDNIPLPALDGNGNSVLDVNGNPVYTTTSAEEIYENYQIKMEVAAKPTADETLPDGSEVKSDKIVFTLARKTPVEIQLEKLLAQ